jgi:hypothetical protein
VATLITKLKSGIGELNLLKAASFKKKKVDLTSGKT